MPMSREAKTAWQRQQRALAAIAAGREPHVTGRPATGRTTRHHGDRAGQRIRARLRLRQRHGDNGTTCDHPILEAARLIASRHARRDRGVLIYQPLHEEAVSAAALALVAGEDADHAARETVRAERDWWARTCLLEEVA